MAIGNMAVLPIEVLSQVFSYLDLNTKQNCRLVCPDWTATINQFFSCFNAHLNRNTLATFKVSSLTLRYRSVTVSNLSSTSMSSELEEFGPSGWHFSTNLLIFAPFEVSLSASQWANLRCGKWLPSVSSDQIALLLTSCQHLERLIFLRNSLVVINPIAVDQLSLQYLTHLEIEFSYDPSLVENERFKEIANISTPALTHLSLQMRISLCSHQEALHFYSSLFSTIISKKSSLKSLFFSFDVVIFPFDPSMINDATPELDTCLRHEISDIQLEEFRFSFCLHESVPPFNLGSKLLANQRSLKAIQASLLNGCAHLYPLIGGAIEANSQTLTSLGVENGSYPGKNLKAEILTSVCSCPHLQFLRFSGFKINSLSEVFRKSSNTLTSLELAGTLNPRILREIKVLKNLEYLKFWYNMSVDVSHYHELETNLREVTRMPRLMEVKLLVGGLPLDFLLDEPGIKITGNRNGLYECTITVLKIRNNNFC